MIHIVPAVPPLVDGLADYCYKLWSHWPTTESKWHCLTRNVPDNAKEHWPEVDISKFEPTTEGLANQLKSLNSNCVVLHYVSYAYDPKGIPTWLPKALHEWKTSRPDARLIIMFHELWPTESPLKKSFWLKPVAKRIIADLEKECAHWVTSCQLYHDKILTVGATPSKGTIAPIPTLIEPNRVVDFHAPWPLAQNKKIKVAVFGQGMTRVGALAHHTNLLRRLCEKGVIEQITLIGKKLTDEAGLKKQAEVMEAIGFPELWKEAYNLPERELSDLLLEHQLGLIRDFPAIITKSSVFAALCTHGIVPVCIPTPKREPYTPEDERTVPFIENDDQNIEPLVQKLTDSEEMHKVKLNVERIATTSLSWPSIAGIWQRVLNDSN